MPVVLLTLLILGAMVLSLLGGRGTLVGPVLVGGALLTLAMGFAGWSGLFLGLAGLVLLLLAGGPLLAGVKHGLLATARRRKIEAKERQERRRRQRERLPPPPADSSGGEEPQAVVPPRGPGGFLS